MLRIIAFLLFVARFLLIKAHFTEYFQILEEKEPGSFVGNITTRANFTYRFSDPNEDNFRIEAKTGSIFTKQRIDREKLSNPEIVLLVLSSEPIYPTEVKVKILDINDNTPVFPKRIYELEIPESDSIGSLYPLNGAVDIDSGSNSELTYSIVGGNRDKFALEIVQNPLGATSFVQLNLTANLDRETVSSYILTLSATDKGKTPLTGYCTLNITILDVNDEQPLFNPTSFKAALPENAPVGSTVTILNSTDGDLGENGRISYYIKPNSKDDGHLYFSIDPVHGILTTSRMLDFENQQKYAITVIARDHGSPALESRALVQVEIQDINDNSPKSTSVVHNPVKLKEDHQIGSMIAFLSFSDQDSAIVNGELAIHIARGNENSQFKLNVLPGRKGKSIIAFLLTNKLLDREKQDKYNLSLIASDRGTPQLSSTLALILEIDDVNDCIPKFLAQNYTSSIRENSPRGSSVLTVHANDCDLGKNGQVQYSITAGNKDDWFVISSETGLLTTNTDNLDREVLKSGLMILTITAQDHGTPSLSTNTQVEIAIEDVNDFIPQFEKSKYVVHVKESLPTNSEILTVVSRDQDGGQNGVISYTLGHESQHLSNMFGVHKSTGNITLLKALDYEMVQKYTFSVVATDGGVPALWSRSTVEVNVVDVNDNIPFFLSYRYYSVLNFTSSCEELPLIQAYDPDSGFLGKVQFEIVSGNSGSVFYMNSTSGKISCRMVPQSPQSFHLTVRASDRDGKYSRRNADVYIYFASIVSRLTFSRDHYSFAVPENTLAGVKIGRALVVSNVPKSSSVEYIIVDGDPWKYVNISGSGELQVAFPMDREVVHSLFLSILAKTNDSVPLLGQTKVALKVLDQNDNSPFVSLPSNWINVIEDLPEHSIITTLRGSDKDHGVNAKLSFHLVGGYLGYFYINEATGALFLLRSLINQTQSTFKLTVQVSDHGKPPRHTQLDLYLQVVDKNDHPPRFAAREFTVWIPDSTPVNSNVLKLNVSDQDKGINQKYTLRILSGNEGGSFGLFPNGMLYLRKLLHKGSYKSSYTLQVQAKDHGTPSKESQVRVIVHVNSTTSRTSVFLQHKYLFVISENMMPGTWVGNISLSSGTANQHLTLKVIGKQKWFSVSSRGVVNTKMLIDREEVVLHTGSDRVLLKVAGRYQKGSILLEDECAIEIRVTDLNDNGPVLQASHVVGEIMENVKIGTYVLMVHAVDADSEENSGLRYEIIGDHSVKRDFDISPNGIIRVKGKIDRESVAQYNFTVNVSDSKNQSLSTVASCEILVLDQNDNPPTFIGVETSLYVSENTNLGTKIFSLSARDRDSGINSMLSYKVSAGNGLEFIGIDKHNGDMYLMKALDYESIKSLRITVTVTDHGTTPLTSLKTLNVIVTDENDNTPIFANHPLVFSINENTKANTVVGQCSVTDLDSGPNAEVKYYIIENKANRGKFSLTIDTCRLSLNFSPDREVQEVYFVDIRAEDQAVPVANRLSAVKRFTVLIQDLNDNSPFFVSHNAIAFKAPLQVNSVITTIKAVDPDLGRNGTIKFKMGGLDSNLFSLESSSGNLIAKSDLRNIGKTFFNLSISAEDQGQLRLYATTRLILFRYGLRNVDIRFEKGSYLATVKENNVIGSFVTKVRAYPISGVATLKYFIIDGNVNMTFDINEDTGILSTGRLLDYETDIHSYSLTLFAVDVMSSKARTANCVVRISLLDVNDMIPHFTVSSANITLYENATINTFVYHAKATDADTVGNTHMLYKILAGNVANSFGISSKGLVTVKRSLDREKVASYLLVLQVEDGGNNRFSSSMELHIHILDLNDNGPVFSSTYYSFSVAEDDSYGHNIGTVTAKDRDIGRNGELYYTINKGSNLFSLDTSTGTLYLQGVLDYEKEEHYMVHVTASDYGSPRHSSSVWVYINVQDVNDNAPKFTKSLFYGKVFENQPRSKIVTQMIAVDEDAELNGKIVYSIINGNEKDNFGVMSNGSVFTKRPLDREEKNLYLLRIRAEDQAFPTKTRRSAFATLSVAVLDVNDNTPTFSDASLTFTVSETLAVGATVASLTASDSDDGSNCVIAYTVVRSDAGKVLQLQSHGGIVLKSPLDFEKRQFYNMTVEARDSGSPSLFSRANLTILVQDENDNYPIVKSHPTIFAVSENVTTGYTVTKIIGTDKDSGFNGKLSYSISSSIADLPFGIDSETGRVYTIMALDREKQENYSVIVTVSDSGNPPRRTPSPFTIRVTDINDCYPTFPRMNYSGHISENLSGRTLILQLRATDCDWSMNSRIRYNLVGQAPSDVFMIDQSSGNFYGIKSLDREKQARYDLTVIASDFGNPVLTSSVFVSVFVTDKNDNSPIISVANSTVVVNENMNSNVEVARVIAKDSDAGRNAILKFSLDLDYGRFRIDSAAGVIYTTSQLDRESQSSYDLSVRVSDSGLQPLQSSITIRVVVGDVNDNGPRFGRRRYVFKVPANAPRGILVTRLSCSDADSEAFSNAIYSLQSGNRTLFFLDRTTGVLTTLTVFPPAARQQVVVKAEDAQRKDLFDTAALLITSDSGFPVFSHTSQHITISESTPVGTRFLTVNATSPDDGPAGKVRYFIASHADANLRRDTTLVSEFGIEQSTGKLFVNSKLDYEKVVRFSLWIEARDSKNPPLSSFVSIIVSLRNVNDTPPVCSGTQQTVQVTENKVAPFFVTRLSCRDADNRGTSRRIRFAVERQAGSSWNMFGVDAVSGEIRTIQRLDREQKAAHYLIVTAFMADNIRLKSTLNISILVTDENDNPPVISGPTQVSLKENADLNTTLAFVSGTDDDAGSNANIVFSMSNAKFQVNSETGRIFVTGTLDRERSAYHNLRVDAYDGVHRVSHHIKVDLIDVNDSPPLFTNQMYYINMSEAVMPGGRVFGFSYTDLDLGLNKESRFWINSTSVLDVFSVNAFTGELYLNKKVSYRKQLNGEGISANLYRFSVKVRNVAPPFLESVCDVFLQIVDANDHAPVFLERAYNVHTSAAMSLGTVLLFVTAVDREDTGNNAQVRYREHGGNGSSLFDVTSVGQIIVSASLVSAVNRIWELQVISQDLGSPVQSALAFVYITVEPENSHPPVFEATSVVKTISENFPLFQEIARVKATDIDSGVAGEVLYFLEGENTQSVFRTGVRNGSIFAVKGLDFETATRHVLKIKAADSSRYLSRSAYAQVTIILTDINDNPPEFKSNSYHGRLEENSPPNMSIMKVEAVDRDSTSTSVIRYSLIGSGKEHFSIGSSSGIISSRSRFDYETQSEYVVTVSASDNGSPPLTSTVSAQIEIVGKNEYPPRFSRKLYTFTAYDNTKIGSVIGKVSATDKDKGLDGVMTYFLMSSTHSGLLTVDKLSGVISVERQLMIGVIVVEIAAKNAVDKIIKPENTDNASITVNVLDGNDPPIFDRDMLFVNVSEASLPRTNIIQVKARDPDAIGAPSLRYWISDGDKYGNFLIDPADGWVFLKIKLDREQIADINLTLSVTDNGRPPATANATVLITVLDVNDSPPEIVNCSGFVYENASDGTVVTRLNVVDADLEANRAPVTFQILTQNVPFTVNTSSLSLVVSGTLDRETKDSYDIRISVREQTSVPLQSVGSCRVTVLDVSDVTPQARNALVVYNIVGSKFLGGVLGDLSPIDADLSDKYHCNLAEPSILFKFKDKSCLLEGVPSNTPGRVTLNYSSTGPHRVKVQSIVELKYQMVEQITENNSVIVRLQNVTREKFVAEKYKSLLAALNRGNLLTVSAVSISSVTENITDVIFVATKPGSIVAANRSVISKILEQRRALIQTNSTASSVQIGRDTCSEQNPCKNGGRCRYVIVITGTVTAISSPKVIFHSLDYENPYICTCKSGFEGSKCQVVVRSCTLRPCRNGGTCIQLTNSFYCTCKREFTGRLCENDVDECTSSPCKNGGKCVNTLGSFVCECTSGYLGRLCETERDQCNPNPCQRSGRCVKQRHGQFQCICSFGTSGELCQFEGLSFTSVSYLSIKLDSRDLINVTMEIATVIRSALLVYAVHLPVNNNFASFIAMEIVSGHVRISCRYDSTVTRLTSTTALRLDGAWERISAIFEPQGLVLSVNGQVFSSSVNDVTRQLNFADSTIFFGGVNSVSNITDYKAPLSTTGFVGCMQNVFVNGHRKNTSHSIGDRGTQVGCHRSPQCLSKPCGRLGACHDLWSTYRCACKDGFTGTVCDEVIVPYSLGGSARVEFRLTAAYRRTLELQENGVKTPVRRRRNLRQSSPEATSVSIVFRTRQQSGALMVAEDFGGNFTILQLRNGKLVYSFDVGLQGSGVSSLSQPMLNDGVWHNVTLQVNPFSVLLTIDNHHTSRSSFTVPTHRFFSSKSKSLTFGGQRKAFISSGEPLPYFLGCFDGITLNHEKLLLRSSSQKLAVIVHGKVSRGCDGKDVCASSPCRNPAKPYCVDQWEAFKCTEPGACALSPCQHGGKCVPFSGRYKCNCMFNFTGLNCETPIQCLLLPCSDGQRCTAAQEGIRCVPLAAVKRASGLDVGVIVVLVFIAAVILAIFVGCLGGSRRRQLRKLNAITKDPKSAIVLPNKQTEKYLERSHIDVNDVDNGMYHQITDSDGIILVNEFTGKSRLPHCDDDQNDDYLRQLSSRPKPSTRERLRNEMRMLTKSTPSKLYRSQPLNNGHVRWVDGDQRVSNLSLPLQFTNIHSDAHLSLSETKIDNPNMPELETETSFVDARISEVLDDPQNTRHSMNETYGRSRRESNIKSIELNRTNAIGRQKVKSAETFVNPLKERDRVYTKSLPSKLSNGHLSEQGSGLTRWRVDSESPLPPMESGFESTGSESNYSDDPAMFEIRRIDDSSSQLEHYDLEVASMGFSEMSWQCDSSIDMRENTINDIDHLVITTPSRFFDLASRSSDDRGLSDMCDRFSDIEPPESSSDSDDSFTCSEFEYGEDRNIHNKKRKQLIFSKLADGVDDDIPRPRHFRYLTSKGTTDRFSYPDSASDTSASHGRTSTSSADFIPPSRRAYGPHRPRMVRSVQGNLGTTQSVDWDELLNWAMKYENLKGVYNSLGCFDFDANLPIRLDSEANQLAFRERQLRLPKHLELSFPPNRLEDVPESEVEEYV